MHGCDGTLKAATVLGVLVMCTGILPLLVKQYWAVLVAAVSTAIIGVLLILFSYFHYRRMQDTYHALRFRHQACPHYCRHSVAYGKRHRRSVD
nr:hypothetical protein [Bacteroides graminisolvens]